MLPRREVLTGMAAVGLGLAAGGGEAQAAAPHVFLVFDTYRRRLRAQGEIRAARGDDVHIVTIDARWHTLDPGRVTARDEVWIACLYDDRLHFITRPLREALPRSIRITLT